MPLGAAMPYTLYLSDTSSELQDLRPVVLGIIRDAGFIPAALDDDDRSAPDLLARLRRKLAGADFALSILAYKRGWEPAGMDGRALAEVEYDLARALGKPLAALLPEPSSELAMLLRRRALNDTDADRQQQAAFWARVQADGAAVYFGDEADLSRQVMRLLDQWRLSGSPAAATSPSTVMRAADEEAERAAPAPPQTPAPAPAAPSRTAPGGPPLPEAAPSETAEPGWWLFRRRSQAPAAPLPAAFDLDALAEQIAGKTAALLDVLDQQRHEKLAEQALKVKQALDLWPGELVFGRPAKGRQFQTDIFMIMPFAPDFDPVYRDIVRPLAAELGLAVRRGDEFASVRGSIMEEIWAVLNACRFVIADISANNLNVFYELGIAHTLNKPALLITRAQKPEEVPFDVRHLRYIAYENTPDGGEQLRGGLRAAITRLLGDLQEGERR